MKLTNANIVEIALVQLILYTVLFLWNDHVAFLLCTIFAAISAAILIISYLLELIERSNVPRWYYRLMWITTICPLLVLLLFRALGGITFLEM